MPLSTLTDDMHKAYEYLQTSFQGIQVGRATPGLVEHLHVETAYGSFPINQIASITLPDNQSIRIEPREKVNVKKIEKAIQESQTGLNPLVPADYVLVKIPPLTGETRAKYSKQVSAMAEECKARIRVMRQDELKHIKKAFEAKELSEDERKNLETNIDTDVKSINEKIDTVTKAKQKELEG